MGERSPGSGPAPAGAGAGEGTRTFSGREPVTRPLQAGRAAPPPGPPTELAQPHAPTEPAPPHLPTGAALPPVRAEAAQPRPAADVFRYGPGVPVTQSAGRAGPAAELLWRTGQPPAPPRRRRRLRGLAGSALTAVLLLASGAILYLRFHHAPFQVTGVVISQQTPTGCGVDVIGRISTNGAAGTVSYEWLFQPGQQSPQPLSQSAVAGQQAVYVTVAIQGRGHGSAAQTVTLQVLGPDPGTASAAVTVRC